MAQLPITIRSYSILIKRLCDVILTPWNQIYLQNESVQEHEEQQHEVVEGIIRVAAPFLNAEHFWRIERRSPHWTRVPFEEVELEQVFHDDNRLGVRDHGNPEGFRGSRHRQRSPQEDHEGQRQWEERRCADLIVHNAEITDDLGAGVESVHKRSEELRQEWFPFVSARQRLFTEVVFDLQKFLLD